MDNEKLNGMELTEEEAEEVDGGRGGPVGRCAVRESKYYSICTDKHDYKECRDCPKNPDLKK